ncbi:MAG: T9SS type A sorting domain-containing protein [Bacteroidales bacterium]
MKKIIFSLFLMIFIINSLQSQSIRFNRMYHHSLFGNTRFNQIVPYYSNYITFGHYEYKPLTSNNEFIGLMSTKVDSLGDLIIKIPYNDTVFNYMLSGWSSDVKTKDGGFIISGSACENKSPYTYNGFLMKLDSNLTMQWRRHYNDTSATSGWTYRDYGFQCLKLTPDNGFIAVGIRYKNSGMSCGLAVKYDSLGNQQWLQTYNLNYYWSEINNVILVQDGYVFGGGGGISADNNTVDDIVIKTDMLGNEIWQKNLGGSKGDGWITLQNYTEGNILAFATKCDSAYTSTDGSYMPFLNEQFYKLSAATGDTIWSLSYGPVKYANGSFAFRTFPDGSALASGTYDYSRYPWLLHLTAGGNVDWYREYRITNPNHENYFYANPYDLQQTADSGFVICGDIANIDTIYGGGCGWILKTDKHGCYTANCDTATDIQTTTFRILSSLELYPNPATTEVTLSYFPDMEKPVLEIYNSMGSLVKEIPLPKARDRYTFSVAQLAKGYYKVILKDNGYVRGQAGLVIK